jgi:hypothetical protein
MIEDLYPVCPIGGHDVDQIDDRKGDSYEEQMAQSSDNPGTRIGLG